MAVYKQTGSNVWWYEFQFDGKRYRESAKTTSKTVAAEALKARRRQLEEAFNGIKKRQMPKTFSAALDEFLAVKQAEGRSQHVRNHEALRVQYAASFWEEATHRNYCG